MDVVIVRSRFGGVLGELGEMLADSMRTLGADVGVCDSRDDAVRDGRVVLLLGAGPEFDAALTSAASLGIKSPRVVLWGLDPLPPPDVIAEGGAAGMTAGRRLGRLRRLDQRTGSLLGPSGRFGAVRRAARAAAVGMARVGSPMPREMAFAFERLAWLESAVSAGRIHRVLVSSASSVRSLAARGISSELATVRFHPSMGRNLHHERDIDVIFLGTTLDSRADRIARLEAQFQAAGVRLVQVDRAYFGEERAALLNRCRVSVNVHKFPWHLERIRFHLSMACGAAVVSELPVPDLEPFVVGRHLLAAPLEDLGATVLELLADEPRRLAIAENASRLIEDQEPDLRAVAEQILVA
ncbi:MAG TPA: glycosyltransferase [Acidimicrobiales bacterium]|nr:glycosyltransferase [Acidimicrobiales bacterium]